MAFLDNSGDIILDAVLTDEGRVRLARGDGSFRISKFALGDDEIDYSLYNKNAGSADVDIDILSTPVLEAFTDNATALKTKLMTIPRGNLLYLPVLKLFGTNSSSPSSILGGSMFLVSADGETDDFLAKASSKSGIFTSVANNSFEATIKIDQGLDADLDLSKPLDSDLVETQYIVEMDDRLGMMKDKDGNSANKSYVDDDKIASYYLSSTTNPLFVAPINTNPENPEETDSSIRGPRGTRLQFKIRPSTDLQYSDFLFERFGSIKHDVTLGTETRDLKYIDTNVRVTGATTGFRIDVPVRFIKL